MAELSEALSDALMGKDVRLNYVLMTDETHQRFVAACDQLGWARKSLVQQCIQSFFTEHRSFYCNAAIADAAARGIHQNQYYSLLRDGDEGKLPVYLNLRPSFGESPIATTPPVPTDTSNRRRYSTVTMGDFNYVLLKVAKLVDNDSWAGITSRIVSWHFSNYWENVYLPQIAMDEKRTFELPAVFEP
ncbi:MAG: hypothetical protein HLUCCA11_19820 [Phormidesmis priestleyi Ana]|uniref:Uncharacterized protein n=1 Tax=Phormidesmis priestleyi Ana TaxID=1666911 RepID=A0A0N8KM82_9CYAN|nr:MAG: hypothetical protein HLUCCA11_19820 [Phormidesmis priestleyi Ana]